MNMLKTLVNVSNLDTILYVQKMASKWIIPQLCIVSLEIIVKNARTAEATDAIDSYLAASAICCTKNQTVINITVVNKVIHNIDNDEKICDIENADGCFIKFKYYYNAENVVRVEYEKEIFCFNGLK
ncbi:hypothetical protein BDFB_003549, partial [Asbolus verrucosus]